MTDWSKPSLTDPYASVLSELMARDTSSAKLSYFSDVNVPDGAISWNPNTYQFEKYSASGGNWSPWTTQLNIKTLLLGANSASGTMQAVPRSQADNLYLAAGATAVASKVLASAGAQAAPSNGQGLTGGVTMQDAYNNGYPSGYGNVLTLYGAGVGQLLLGWSGITGGVADNYIRSLRDAAVGSTSNGWSPWAKILTDQNYSSICAPVNGNANNVFLVKNSNKGTQQAVPRAQADNLYQPLGNYLPLGGGTLTGPLTVKGDCTANQAYHYSSGIWGGNLSTPGSNPWGGQLVSNYGTGKAWASLCVRTLVGSYDYVAIQLIDEQGNWDELQWRNTDKRLYTASGHEFAMTSDIPAPFQSGWQVISSNTIISVAHNLGRRPNAFGAFLQNINPEYGYNQYDYAAFSLDDGAARFGPPPVRADSSNLYLATGDSQFRIINQVWASNADWVDATLGNWRLIFWAIP